MFRGNKISEDFQHLFKNELQKVYNSEHQLNLQL